MKQNPLAGRIISGIVGLIIVGLSLQGCRAETRIPETSLPTATPSPQTMPNLTPTLTATATPGTRYQVAIWAPYTTIMEIQTLIEHQDVIREINFFWYELGAGGELRGDIQSAQAIRETRQAGMRIIPSIMNGFSPDRVAYVVRDPLARSKHIQEIVQLVQDQGYDGIDIDYESMYAEDREAFSLFIEELAAALHKQGKLLSIAVHAKTNDAGEWGGAASQDWKRLGAAVDEFKIMTYDYHNGASTAGAIAPLEWVDQVLTYAASVVPPEKTYMGLHFYGYDWVNAIGTSLTWHEITKLMGDNQVSAQRDENNEAWFTYGSNNRTVYFADALMVKSRLQAMLEKHPGLAGIAIWRLGGEDPQNWQVIRELFFR